VIEINFFCSICGSRLERFILEWNQFCWLKRSRMVAWLARVVAKAYGQASQAIRRPVSANPQGPGIFPPGSAAIGSHVPGGMRFANRHCPNENLLRQNCFHSRMNRSGGAAVFCGNS